ncbi:MAG: SatD family protein [Spirochaetaceae bacterium]|nr:SatD family protein [Spirochaetaceae bacterium]MCF7952164.1 SatD family protein [Spirochaetaceae bacterium]
MYTYHMKVVVLIADIIESREIEDRSRFQDDLGRCLNFINTRAHTLLSPYTVTLGDEFQAVYATGAEVLDHIIYIQTELFPVKFRFSVSFGEITTKINRKQAIGMDGPVFHEAREGITRLKKTKYSVIGLSGLAEDELEIVNSGLGLASAVMAGWKAETLHIFHALYQGLKVSDILPHYDLSQRGMYKLINRNRLWEFTRFFESVREELKKLQE